LSSGKVAAITASSFAAAFLLAYLGYVGWYGRWGLPRLERVRQHCVAVRSSMQMLGQCIYVLPHLK
jgi:hypothetical protein